VTDQNPTTSPEIFKPIPGFPGYDVSDQGRVRSYIKVMGPGMVAIVDTPQRILTGTLHNSSKGGKLIYYRRVCLSQHISICIHTLVLLAFVGPSPPEMECRHLDGDSLNNHLYNLRWGTRSENALDKTRHGTHWNQRGMNGPNTKLNDNQVIQVRELHSHGWTQKKIGIMFDVSRTTVKHIIHRKTWKHI
jgi:hypothetical protein